MKKLFIALLFVILTVVSSHASILVFSPNGSYTVKSTLADANTAADVSGKTVVVTSALSAIQSNISSATVHGWRTDAALKVEKGGSINPTTKFTGLPEASPEMFGVKGDGVTDDNTALQRTFDSVIDGGKITLSNTYLHTALTFSKNNCHIGGNGTLKKKTNVTGVALIISGDGNTLKGIVFDGSNPQLVYNNDNDTIRLTGDKNTVQNVTINTSAGGGIVVFSSDNKILNNKLYNLHDNGIEVVNSLANRNLIDGNTIDGTVAQNGIFLTASGDSTPTSDYIYDNIVTNNIIRNCADTSIESGIHTVRTIIANNNVDVKANPGILLRDSIGVSVESNIVNILSTAVSDGIAISAQTENSAWISQSNIVGNIITGYVVRSAIYVEQSDIAISNNKIKQTGVTIDSAGSNLAGSGIIFAGSSGLSAINNEIENYYTGINLNYPNTTPTYSDINISNNKIKGHTIGINLYNVALSESKIQSNYIKKTTNVGLYLTGSSSSATTEIKDNKINPQGYSTVGNFLVGNMTGATMMNNCISGFTVPVTQGDILYLALSGYKAGQITLEFGTSSYSIIDIFPGGYNVRQHSSDIAVDLLGSVDWGVGLDNSNLILKRLGTTIGAVGDGKLIR